MAGKPGRLGEKLLTGGRKVRIAPRVAAVLDGVDRVEDWDEEELWEGRRRGKDGSFRGVSPVLVPAEAHRELVRRKMAMANHTMAYNLLKAVDCLVEIASDKEADARDRIKASIYLMDRVLGKTPETVNVNNTGEVPPWQQALNMAIVGSLEQAKNRVIDVSDILGDEIVDP